MGERVGVWFGFMELHFGWDFEIGEEMYQEMRLERCPGRSLVGWCTPLLSRLHPEPCPAL